MLLLVANSDENTPLLQAVVNGDFDACKLLLDFGADCGIRNIADMTTTWAAAYYNRRSILRYLIVHGNPPLSVPSRGPKPDFKYKVARTPLHVAIGRKHFGIAELLLDARVMMYEESWCWSSSSVDSVTHPNPTQLKPNFSPASWMERPYHSHNSLPRNRCDIWADQINNSDRHPRV